MKTVTIHNLAECSAQEVFDFISHHLLAQNKRAVGSNGGCCYRLKVAGEVLRCAAGCLIPDNVYQSNLEGRMWGYLVNFRGYSNYHQSLIESLQDMHDNHPVRSWETRLQEIAKSYL